MKNDVIDKQFENMPTADSVVAGIQSILSFPARENRVPSDDERHHEGQRLGERIYKLGEKLSIPDQCVCIAMEIMHRFFRQHSDEGHDFLSMCPAAMFVACPYEMIFLSTMRIRKAAAELLKIPVGESEYQINAYRCQLIHYAFTLVKKLGSAVIVDLPESYIGKAINKISETKLLPEEKRELIATADYLALQIVLHEPFRNKYAFDLVGYACVQLVLEIESVIIEPELWLDESITFQQVQDFIDEFSCIFRQPAHVFADRFVEKINLYERLIRITSDRVALQEERAFALALIGEQAPAHPSASMDNTTDANSSILSSTLSTVLPLSKGTHQKALRINQTSKRKKSNKSQEVSTSVGTKRPGDSLQDDNTYKRLAMF